MKRVFRSDLTVSEIEQLILVHGQANVTILPDGRVELLLHDKTAEIYPDAVDDQKLQLGKQTPLPKSPDEASIDVVASPGGRFVARFTAPEFTSLCPVTGQPDFARIFIDYVPDKLMIESKALKLFLGSFRNHGAFHESCTMMIAQRLQDACRPKWMRVAAYWYPRGGIPIDVFWQNSTPPDGILIPDLPKFDFMGR